VGNLYYFKPALFQKSKMHKKQRNFYAECLGSFSPKQLTNYELMFIIKECLKSVFVYLVISRGGDEI
jgi:hypothetical protein